jgi:hypothetical protein
LLADYVLFQRILDLFNGKAHLTTEGLQQIVNLRASLNKGLSLELNKAFPLWSRCNLQGWQATETIPVPIPLVNDPEIKNPY